MLFPLTHLSPGTGVVVKRLSQLSSELRFAIAKGANPNDIAAIGSDSVLLASQMIAHAKNIYCLPGAVRLLSDRFSASLWVKCNNSGTYKLPPEFQLNEITLTDTIVLSDLVTATFPYAAIVYNDD